MVLKTVGGAGKGGVLVRRQGRDSLATVAYADCRDYSDAALGWGWAGDAGHGEVVGGEFEDDAIADGAGVGRGGFAGEVSDEGPAVRGDGVP